MALTSYDHENVNSNRHFKKSDDSSSSNGVDANSESYNPSDWHITRYLQQLMQDKADQHCRLSTDTVLLPEQVIANTSDAIKHNIQLHASRPADDEVQQALNLRTS